MDAELAALSSAAATTLVALMTTDAWERARGAFAGLWRHRPAGEAQSAEADLEAAQLKVRGARQVGDERAELAVLGEWLSRLGELAAADQRFQDEMRKLVEEFRPLLEGAREGPQVVMRAEVSGSGRVNQAGRDQTVISG